MPTVPLLEVAVTRERLKKKYDAATKVHFKHDGIALSVVRTNLKNRLDHARRIQDQNKLAIIYGEISDRVDVLPLSPLAADATPEQRVEAFLSASNTLAVEAHAELLTPISENPAQMVGYGKSSVLCVSV